MARFSEALARAAEEIKAPPPLPLGHYIMRVTKVPDAPSEVTFSTGSADKLTFNVETVSAYDDVDPDMLAEYGNPAGRPMRLEFLFNHDDEIRFETTLNQLKAFLANCGIDTDSGTLQEWINDVPNRQFLGQIGHQRDKNDASIVYARIGRTSAVD